MDSKVLQKTKSLLSGLFATHCRAADDSSAWPRGTAIIDRTTMHDSKCHKECNICSMLLNREDLDHQIKSNLEAGSERYHEGRQAAEALLSSAGISDVKEEPLQR